ncbi:DNA primase noncatalytic subunit PriX [Candidatus Nitrosocosmicus hydrocola]|uniref:DNA primase noncatalytic subunit PriX n=1 Tax=Candidatus Nitrosocosmicus hydrocola TaxID=1826872 RepID=UPI0011E58F22|nr:DNA primase noncatalytic subunit PriX [Candidatus Nitrosocosmicus hydrocola]
MGVKILNTIEESIDFILSHFDHQKQDFPRTMMTEKQNWQFTVTSKEEVLRKCEESDYIDCRINAYPEYTEYKGIVRHPPDFVFMDLDLVNFNSDKSKLDRILKRTINKIEGFGSKPTVIWSGNGYHVYIPLSAIVLDQEDIFSKDRFPSLFHTSFSKYYNYSVSEVFLKFAKNYFTDGKADPLHHPKYGNSLIRVPDTYNSKCLNRGLSKEESKVKIIQKWDGKRLPIQLLLKDFRRWIVQEEINYSQQLERLSKKKNLRKLSECNFVIDWIENLLKTPMEDQRNYCLWAILVPYLLNVKHLSEEDTFNILKDWLQNCNDLKKLRFDPKSRIYSTIRGNKRFKPISYSKLKENNRILYSLLENKLIKKGVTWG